MKEWVEVVRCKYCVHNYGLQDPNYQFCGLFHIEIKPNGYCSRGWEYEERKDG